jgi:ferredoxin
MRLRVDGEKCQGHNRCVAIAPALVEIDDLGYAHERGDGSVPDDELRAAELAVANCPENAISLEDE